MKQAKPHQPAGVLSTAPPYTPGGRAAFVGDVMTDGQRSWLTAIRVSAKVLFVICVLGGIGWAYEMGNIPFVQIPWSLRIGVIAGFTVAGFMSAVFLNMAGDILEMKCFMKSQGGK
jgi:hypothetical protein